MASLSTVIHVSGYRRAPLNEEAPEVGVVGGLSVGSSHRPTPQGIFCERKRDDDRHIVNVGCGCLSSRKHRASIMALASVEIEQA